MLWSAVICALGTADNDCDEVAACRERILLQETQLCTRLEGLTTKSDHEIAQVACKTAS